jgi:hypothetical protein
MLPPTTPVQRLGVVFARLAQPCQPSPVPRPDRPAHRPFRGLLGVHSRCGLHTRTVTVCRDRYPKASDTSSPPCLLRSLPAGANRRVGLAPTGKRRLVTAHVESRLGRLHSDRRSAPIPAVRGTEIEWARLPEANLPVSIPYRDIVELQTTTAGVGPDTPESAFQRLAAVNSLTLGSKACQTGAARFTVAKDSVNVHAGGGVLGGSAVQSAVELRWSSGQAAKVEL